MNPANIDRKSLRWRIAKKSGTANCVEVARVDGNVIAFRKSSRPDGEMILYTVAEFDAFIDGIKRGEFDDLLS